MGVGEEGIAGSENPFIEAANSENDVLVIGGANVDRTYRLSEDRVQVSE